MDEGDYTVDLDELASVIDTLEKCERALETLTDDVEKQMGVLHETWEGLSAQAQREAQEEWNLGMVEMRAALADLRQAAQVAGGNYHRAITANAALWSGLT